MACDGAARNVWYINAKLMRTRTPFLAAVPLALALIGGCFSGSSGGGNGTGDSGFPTGDDSGFPTIVDSGGGGDVTVSEGGSDAAVTGQVTTTPIDFGTASCGSTPSPATMTYSLKNTGPVPVTYSATANSIFTIQGASSGTVAPGATGTITIAAGVVPTTSNAGVAVTGSISLTTNIPGFTNVLVPLKVTPQGGTLIAPATVGFGLQQINTTSNPVGFGIQNVGNAPVSVAFGAATDSEFSVTGGGSIAPGTSLTGGSATFSPSSPGAKSGTSPITVTGALCATPPNLAVPLSGTATLAQVSIGPSPLNFNSVACGQTGAPQTVTIKNGYATPITYMAALAGSPSPYSISSSGGTVPANGQVVITVTPSAIPALGANLTAGAYSDTLTISTSAPNTTPLAIPLQESAFGAILALNMPNTNFGTVTSSATLPFTVVNTGNVAASVSVATTGSGYSASLSSGTVGSSGASDDGSAMYVAVANGTFTGSLSVGTTTPLCAPLPPAITMTATGAVPVVTGPSTVAVTGTCGVVAANGTQAPATGSPTTITLLNSGNASASYSVTSPQPGANYTIISGASGTIASGSTANIVLQGTVPAGSAGGATPAGSLTYATNEPAGGTHTVAITSTIFGANLYVQAPSVTLSTCNGFGYKIVNLGNNIQPVTVIGVAPGYCSPSTSSSCPVNGGEIYYFGSCGDGCSDGTFLNAVQIDPGAANAQQDIVNSALFNNSVPSCALVNPTQRYAPVGPVCVGTNIGADALSLSISFSGVPGGCTCGG